MSLLENKKITKMYYIEENYIVTKINIIYFDRFARIQEAIATPKC